MLEGKKEGLFLSMVIIIGGIVLFLSLKGGYLILSSLVFIYLLLMYKLTKIEPEPYRVLDMKMLKRDIFLWSLFPLSFGLLGVTNWINLELFFIFQDIVLTTFVSIIIFMALIEMDYYTDFQANRPFTFYFIILATIGIGSVFGIIRFLSDRFLNGGYLGGNTHLMVYLLMISILGISIGVNIRDYIIGYDFFPLKNMESDFKKKDNFEGHRIEFLNTLNFLFKEFDDPYLLSLSRALQAGILFTAIYGLVYQMPAVVLWSVFSLLFAISPDIFGRKTRKKVPSLIYFWIAFITFAYAFGRPAGFYGYSPLWAGITHFLTGSVVAVLVFSTLVHLNRVSKNLYIPPYLISTAVLLSIIPIGVLWEISEFYIDLIFDRSLQAGIEDTVFDLICNFVGTLASLVVIYFLFGRKIYHRAKGSFLDRSDSQL